MKNYPIVLISRNFLFWATFVLLVLGRGHSFAQASMDEAHASIDATVSGGFIGGQFDILFSGDDGDEVIDLNAPIYGSDEGSLVVSLRSGVEYNLNLWKTAFAYDAKVRLTAPLGWVFYIAEDGSSDLIERDSYLLSVSGVSTDLTIKMLPRGRALTSLAVGQATAFADTGVYWSVGMGSLVNGYSAGAIQLNYNSIDDLDYEPSDLLFSAPSPEVDYYAPSGVLRQIAAPEALADIVDTGTDKYEIRFYDWAQVTTKPNNLYQLVTNPSAFVVYEISKSASNQVRIKKISGSNTWYTRLVSSSSQWIVYDWTEDGSETSDCLRRVTTTLSGGGSLNYELVVEEGRLDSSASFTTSSKVRSTYEEFDWGRELVKIQEGYGESYVQSTEFEYFDTLGGGDGHYSQLEKITYPNGGEMSFVYYDDFDTRGMVHKRYDPFQDVSDGRRTTYTYQLDVTGDRYVEDTIEVHLMDTLGGSYEQIGKTTFDYYSETWNGEPARRIVRRDYEDTSAYLQTTIREYREDCGASEAYRRKMPISVRRPDGTQTSYAYAYYSSWGVYVFESLEGTSSNPSGEASTYYSSYYGGAENIDNIYMVESKSLKLQSNKFSTGRVYGSYESICVGAAGFELMSETAYAYTAAGLLFDSRRQAYANNIPTGSWNILSEASYDGMQANWSKDETGIKTNYYYDKQGRLDLTIEEGASDTTYNDVDDLHVLHEYDGSNRVVYQGRSGASSSETIDSSWTYDYAGRLTGKTLDCCNTVSYEYPSSDQVKTINDDDGEILENYYKDGSLDSRTGDATTPLYVRSRVSSGKLEVWSASQTFTFSSPYKDNYRMQASDWLGRVSHTRQPTFDGGSRYEILNYDSAGRVSDRRTRTSLTSGDLLAPYRYQYNSVGQLEYEGFDVGNSGTLTTSSNDRVTKYVNRFHKDSSNIWHTESITYAYPSSSAIMTSRTLNRVAVQAGYLSQTAVYDAFGNAQINDVEVSRPEGLVSRVSSGVPSPTSDATAVYKNGLLVKSVDSASVVQEFEYDSLRRLSARDGRDSVRDVYSYYNGTNRVYQEKQGSLVVREHSYGLAGRLTQTVRKNSTGDETTNYQYNARGQVKYAVGDGEYPIGYFYDSYGRLYQQQQYRADNGSSVSVVEWVFDDNYNTGLVKQKRHYGYFFDMASNPSYPWPDPSEYDDTDFVYNDLGQLSQRTWDRGVSTDFGYSMGNTNSTGELLSETHSDSTPDVGYTYDKMGRIYTAADHAGTRTFLYNEHNNLRLGYENLPNGFYGSNNLDYHWNLGGTNAGYRGVSYGGGSWTRSVNSANGRVSSVQATADGSSKTFSYTYDNDSNHVEKVAYGSFSLERYWDSWREVRSKSFTRWGTAYRANFQVPVLDDQSRYISYRLYRNGGDSLAYKYNPSPSYIQFNHTYDTRGQLKSYDRSDSNTHDVTSYSYDSAGNLTNLNYASKSDYSYTYNSKNESSSNGQSYDTDGNLDEDENWYYYYDAYNRLVTMDKKDGTKYLEFRYDYIGRRIEKKVWNNGTGSGTAATHLKFVYEGMTLLAELNSSGSVSRSFHWGLDKSETLGGAGNTEGLLYMRDWLGNQDYYPSYDLNGNVVGLLGSDGEYAAWYAYDANGNVVQSDGAYDADNPIGYSTQYTDRETGLVYYGLRYYSPKMTRFINRDPIAEAGGANLHRFVGNNPISNVDLYGLEPIVVKNVPLAPVRLIGEPPSEDEDFGYDPWNLVMTPNWTFWKSVSFGVASIATSKDQKDKEREKCRDAAITAYKGKVANNIGLGESMKSAYFDGVKASAEAQGYDALQDLIIDIDITIAGSLLLGEGAAYGALRTASSGRALYGAAKSWSSINRISKLVQSANKSANISRFAAGFAFTTSYGVLQTTPSHDDNFSEILNGYSMMAGDVAEQILNLNYQQISVLRGLYGISQEYSDALSQTEGYPFAEGVANAVGKANAAAFNNLQSALKKCDE
ncbi:RHS repeat-associated core domain-containing protein [Puniceicoccaceae bacterium K14]|nr:RHS repeat-associated core domain-containing protein [Puniceicoccaceae bacterium K14]